MAVGIWLLVTKELPISRLLSARSFFEAVLICVRFQYLLCLSEKGKHLTISQ